MRRCRLERQRLPCAASRIAARRGGSVPKAHEIPQLPRHTPQAPPVMTPALHAIAPGPYVTVQDVGRRGWRRFGVACSGAMDMPALAMANALVGNPPDTAALEFAHVGGTWEVMAQSVRVAVTGGSFVVEADGVALAPWRSHT